MPTPKKGVNNYPKEYFLLFEKALSGQLVSVTLANFQEAKLLRGQLYAFRDSLFEDEDSLAAMSSDLSFKIKDHTLVIVKE